MSKITTVRVANSEAGTVVSEFELTNTVPRAGDSIWVPDNGEVAYFILGRRFDYKRGVVTLNCRPNPGLERG